MDDTNTILKKIDGIEKMLWEDRKFLIKMMLKIDKITKFVEDFAMIDEGIFGNGNVIEEEKILKSIMKDIKNDIEDKRDEFIKYHQMINSDQVGES